MSTTGAYETILSTRTLGQITASSFIVSSYTDTIVNLQWSGTYNTAIIYYGGATIGGATSSTVTSAETIKQLTVTANTSYTFTITPYNSATVPVAGTAQTKSIVTLAALTSLSATVNSSSQINLTLTYATNSFYRADVYYKSGSGSYALFNTFLYSTNPTTVLVTGLTSSTTYTFQVKVVNSALVQTAYGTEPSATTATALPYTYTGSTSSYDPNQNGYKVLKLTSNGSLTLTSSTSLTVNYYVIGGGGGGGVGNQGGSSEGGNGGNGGVVTQGSFVFNGSKTFSSIIVGTGGIGSVVQGTLSVSGGNSSISGTGFTTVTSSGGTFGNAGRDGINARNVVAQVGQTSGATGGKGTNSTTIAAAQLGASGTAFPPTSFVYGGAGSGGSQNASTDSTGGTTGGGYGGHVNTAGANAGSASYGAGGGGGGPCKPSTNPITYFKGGDGLAGAVILYWT
jgi:hypothetical protein